MQYISVDRILQVAKEGAVDLKTPPNTKLFDPDYHNDSDSALLSKLHHGLVAINQNAPAASNIVMQNYSTMLHLLHVHQTQHNLHH